MQTATYQHYQRFLQAVEREGISVSEMAGILHLEAYHAMRDACGPRAAMKWQMETTQRMLQSEREALDAVERLSEL